MASFVSGDQSRQQHPAEQSYFSFTVRISILSLSIVEYLKLFFFLKGVLDLLHPLHWTLILYTQTHGCGPPVKSIFATLTENHCFTSWLMVLTSQVISFYRLQQSFRLFLMLTFSPATLVLSKCCVGRTCNIYGLY